MKAKLNKALKNIYNKANELDMSLQELDSMFIYKGFYNEDVPSIQICNGDEVIVVFNGNEMFAEEAIELMLKNECITRDDFYY